MAEVVHAEPPSQTQPSAPRLGSFIIEQRVDDSVARLAGGIAARVTGAPGTQFAGVAGTAYCVSVPPGDASLPERVSALLNRRRSFSHPQVLPALETGLAGHVAYVVEPAEIGETLHDKLNRIGPVPPWALAPILAQLADALGAMHRAGLSHGQLHPGVVGLEEISGVAQLGALSVVGRGPRRDIELLAAFTFEMLTGKRWSAPPAPPEGELDLVGIVRDRLPGLSLRIAAVIASGLEAGKSGALAGPEAFSEEYGRALDGSSAESLNGAFDALNAGNTAMAVLFADSAAKYAPNSSDLGTLRLRIGGQNPADIFAGVAPMPVNNPPVIPASPTASMVSPSAFPDLDPAVVALLSGVQTAPVKSGSNPWMIFAVGLFFCIIALTVVGAITFSAS